MVCRTSGSLTSTRRPINEAVRSCSRRNTAMNRVIDQEVRELASIAAALQGDYAQQSIGWTGSPFAWIKMLPSSSVRGKIGAQLVAGWCAAKGLDVTGSGTPQYDRVIHGYRIEVKFSTLWVNGRYAFQQIRDQDYQYAICLGIAPFDAHCWVIPKEILRRYVIGHTGQHTGAGGQDTAWLRLNPEAPPAWLAPYGGPLRTAYEFLSRLPPGPHLFRGSG